MLSPSLFLFLASLAGVASAQKVPDSIINTDGIGFFRVIDDDLVVFDFVSTYDEYAIVVADCSAFKSRVQGVGGYFSSGKNLSAVDELTQDTGRNHYLPFVGGHCAVGMSMGNLAAKGDPRTAVRIGNQLVLNGRLDVRTSFLRDTERNMDNARLRYELAIAAGNLHVSE